MNKSFIECLETDYKVAIEQMIARIFSSTDRWDENDLPLLKMEYMSDDSVIYKAHRN